MMRRASDPPIMSDGATGPAYPERVSERVSILMDAH